MSTKKLRNKNKNYLGPNSDRCCLAMVVVEVEVIVFILCIDTNKFLNSVQSPMIRVTETRRGHSANETGRL
jgi:hypothetical protein